MSVPFAVWLCNSSRDGTLNPCCLKDLLWPTEYGMEVTKPHDVSFCMLLLSVLEFWHCHMNKPGLACWVMEDTWRYHSIALADNRPTLRLVNEIFLDHQTLLANHRCMSKSGQDQLRQHRSKEPSSHPLELSVIIHSGRFEPLHVGVACYVVTDIFLFFFFFFFSFIYLWLCWVFISVRGLSLVAASGGHSSLWCAGLSLSWPLLLRSTGSRRAGSVIVAHGPSRSTACGILPYQGSNPCPLHWQADSQPLRHQGSPTAPPGKPSF